MAWLRLKTNLGEARNGVISTLLDWNILDTNPRRLQGGETAMPLSSPTMRKAGNIPRLRSLGARTQTGSSESS